MNLFLSELPTTNRLGRLTQVEGEFDFEFRRKQFVLIDFDSVS